jgi:hypothetical protein
LIEAPRHGLGPRLPCGSHDCDINPRGLEALRRTVVNDERIAATDPGNRTFLRALSRDLWCLAVTLQAQGDFAGARDAYHQSCAIAKRLAGSDAKDPKKLRDLVEANPLIGLHAGQVETCNPSPFIEAVLDVDANPTAPKWRCT